MYRSKHGFFVTYGEQNGGLYLTDPALLISKASRLSLDSYDQPLQDTKTHEQSTQHKSRHTVLLVIMGRALEEDIH
jgi:hypothetical protein